jgi:hypothetical protein
MVGDMVGDVVGDMVEDMVGDTVGRDGRHIAAGNAASTVPSCLDKILPSLP